MTPMEFIIAVVHSAGDSVQGRTLLQKLCFFTSRLARVDAQLGFDAHYYGPYSSTLELTVSQLKSIGFLSEESTGFGVYSSGFEMKRYDYRLTQEGLQIASTIEKTDEYARVRSAVEAIKKAGGLDYIALSFAAKVFFIVTKQGVPMSKQAIQTEAPKFNWNIPETSAVKAVDFLVSVGLLVGP